MVPRVIDIGIEARRAGVKEVYISSLIPRKSIEARRRQTNIFLKQLCYDLNFVFIDNSNIHFDHLWDDKSHLQDSAIIEDNFIYFMIDSMYITVNSSYANALCHDISNY